MKGGTIQLSSNFSEDQVSFWLANSLLYNFTSLIYCHTENKV